MVEMVVRLLVICLFSISAAVLSYAYLRRPYSYHLLGIVVWCFHVVIFTVFAAARSAAILSIDPHIINVWSNIVRIHGGIVMFTTGLYYIDSRKDILQ